MGYLQKSTTDQSKSAADDMHEPRSRNGLWLIAAIAFVAISTLGLVRARVNVVEEIRPELEETTELTADVPVDGLVFPTHPVLPARFDGVEDALLASPMLHHPDFIQEVERWVGFWERNFSEWMPVYLGRMRGFEGMVDETLADHGLPWSLRYLPVIESGYSPTAVSSASAVGLWQFMAPTARELGVEVDRFVDDRRDPFVSTQAAADYLVQLHEEFDSWFLALAAYNAGPDRINGILRRYLPDVERSDAVYWALRYVLPKETADFVPNLIGAIIVGSAPTEHGYAEPEPQPFDFEVVPIRGSIRFERIARAAGTTVAEIERLNPEYVRGFTPPQGQIDLRLPPGRAGAFRQYFATSLVDNDR